MRRRRSINQNGIEPLVAETRRKVRFEEIDAMGIMWHGRYPSWLEDGRECFGRRYGIHYLDFFGHGVKVPVKLMNIDYRAPLHYGQTYTIRTILLWSEAAKLEYHYEITEDSGSVRTVADTVQLMLSEQNELLITPPAFYKDFLQKWKEMES